MASRQQKKQNIGVAKQRQWRHGAACAKYLARKRQHISVTYVAASNVWQTGGISSYRRGGSSSGIASNSGAHEIKRSTAWQTMTSVVALAGSISLNGSNVAYARKRESAG